MLSQVMPVPSVGIAWVEPIGISNRNLNPLGIQFKDASQRYEVERRALQRASGFRIMTAISPTKSACITQ